MYIFLAFISGIMVILSMLTNSHLATKVGILKSNKINFLVGLISITIILLITKQFSKDIFSNLPNKDYWIYSAGLVGITVVCISSSIMLKIPTIYSTLLIFTGQIFTGIIIDYIILNNFSFGKLIGGILILSGLLYNSIIDKISNRNSQENNHSISL